MLGTYPANQLNSLLPSYTKESVPVHYHYFQVCANNTVFVSVLIREEILAVARELLCCPQGEMLIVGKQVHSHA